MAIDLKDKLLGKSYVSPGSIGGKIKRYREMRGLTQRELGILCGFSPSTADVRIAQYEKNKKIPRERALKDIAAALGLEEHALYDADLTPSNQLYHILFDLLQLLLLFLLILNFQFLFYIYRYTPLSLYNHLTL